MRNLFVAALLICIAGFTSLIKAPITDQERKSATSYLEESKEFFLNSTRNLSEKQLDFKAAPDRWSIRQCMEHIAVAEMGIFGYVDNEVKKPADSSKRSELKLSDDKLKEMIIDRSVKAKAPEFLQPTGKFKTAEETAKTFSTGRENLIKYINTTQADLRNHCFSHPFFGLLDGYQWVLLIAGHSRRHTMQIVEVKADPNFPKD